MRLAAITSGLARGSYRPPVQIFTPPTAADDGSQTSPNVIDFNEVVDLDVLANDTAGSFALAVPVIIDQPSHGTAAVIGTQIRYTPTADYSGLDSFTYQAQDTFGLRSSTASVHILVSEAPAPETPTFVHNGYTHRARFRVPAASVQGAGTLSSFFLLIDVTSNDLRTVANGGQVVSASGFDIRFENNSETKLSHWLAYYDGAVGRVVAIVRMQINSNGDQTRFLYIGKTLAATEADSAGCFSGQAVAWDTLLGTDLTGQGHDLTPTALAAGTLIGTRSLYNGTTAQLQGDVWAGFEGATAVTVRTLYDLDATAVGQNRGLLAQGTQGQSGASHGIAIYQRALSAAELPNVLISNFLTTGGSAFAVSDQNRHASGRQVRHDRWASGAVPDIFLDGVMLPLSNSSAVAGTTLAATGPVYVGRGPNTATGGNAEPGPWKGEIGLVMIEHVAASDLRVKTEAFNWSRPDLFLGVGAFDGAEDANQGPIAVPILTSCDRDGTVLIDALPRCFDPDGDTLTITGRTNGTAGTTAIESGQIRYTHDGSGSGTETDEFTYTVSDGAKTSTARVQVTITGDGDPGGGGELPAAWPAPIRTITGINTYAKLNTFLTGGTYADPVLGNVTKAAGDHVILEDGVFDGNNIDLVSPGTGANPFVIRAKNLLQSTIAFKITTSGTRAYFWGILFNESQGGVRTGRLTFNGATNPKVYQCELTRWWGDNSATQGDQAGYAISTLGGGSGIEIAYCYIHDPKPWSAAEIAADVNDDTASLRIFVRPGGGNTASFHTNGHIHHCMFASTILRARPNVYASQADLLEIGWNGPSYPNPTSVADMAGWVVEDNIFDGTGAGGRPTGYNGQHGGEVDPNASGVIDIKISGVTFRRNTLRNFKYRNINGTGTTGAFANPGTGRADIRFGAKSRIESCWVSNNVHIGIEGEQHTIIGNVLGAGCNIWCLAGTIASNDYKAGHQLCREAKLIGNVGTIELGHKFTGHTLPVQDARVESHTGTIKTQQNYAGTWDTPTAGQIESGATFTSTPSETVTLGEEIPLTAVGPYAA